MYKAEKLARKKKICLGRVGVDEKREYFYQRV